MGSASSVVATEAKKPLNCSDIKSGEDAREEVKRLRKLLRDHEDVIKSIEKSDNKQNQIVSKQTSSVPAPKQIDTKHEQKQKRVSLDDMKKEDGIAKGVQNFTSLSPTHKVPDLSKYDNSFAKCFDLNESPSLYEYLLHQFYRFCGTDQVLEWDEFWRLIMDLDLGLTNKDIAELRQKCDADRDGFITWQEMVETISPMLGKFWQASLANADEFDQWSHLHWEKHSKVSKTKEGYTKLGHGFWVNKLTGESSWTIPPALEKHPSYVEASQRKKLRHASPPPTLEDFLTEVFAQYSKFGAMTIKEFWSAISEDLHMQSWFTNSERKLLSQKVDINKDGVVTVQEFIQVLRPLLSTIFTSRAENENAWIALEHLDTSTGETYLYWFNRISGESSWVNPITNK